MSVDAAQTVHVHVTIMDIPFMNPERLLRWRRAACSCCSNCPGSARCARSPTSWASPRRRCPSRSRRWPARSGTPLVEPDGRRVRLTPAGRRLAEHAVTILAAVEAARLDLDPDAEPAGTLRVAGFATAVRRSLLPVVADLADEPPAGAAADPRARAGRGVRAAGRRRRRPRAGLRLQPGPAAVRPQRWRRPRCGRRRGALGVPDGPCRRTAARRARRSSPRFRDHDWIVNSRNTADERVVRTLASMAGFEPRVAHRADSLELVQDLIVGRARRRAAARRPADPAGRAAAAARRPGRRAARVRGRSAAAGPRWPPLALVLGMLAKPEGTPVDRYRPVKAPA